MCNAVFSSRLIVLMIDGSSCVFFFKQKTAYEMRISDWSSDVCSSDLLFGVIGPIRAVQPPFRSRASRDDHHPVQPGHGVGQRHRSPTGLPELGKLAGAAEFAKATAQVEGEDLMPPRQPGLPAPHCLARQADPGGAARSEEHTSELQSLMRIS